MGALSQDDIHPMTLRLFYKFNLFAPGRSLVACLGVFGFCSCLLVVDHVPFDAEAAVGLIREG